MTYQLFGLAFGALIGLTSFALISNKKMAQMPTASATAAEKLSPPETKSFRDFLGQFPKVKLPYSIKLDEERMKVEQVGRKDTKPLSFDYGEYVPGLTRGMVSRLGPDDYYPEALLAQNDRYTAVVYYAVSGFRGAIRYYLATYDSKGNEISRYQLMIYHSGSGYDREAKIDKDLNVFIRHREDLEADFSINRKGEITARFKTD
jgi:hypothetical protein